MLSKTEARSIATSRIAGMSPGDVEEKSRRICDRIAECPEWKQAETVALFAALPGEPDLANLWTHSEGKRICFPRSEGELLRFYSVTSMAELKPGAWKVREPPGNLIRLVKPSKINLICVPGVAFTAEGHRVGRGRGYYDRYLDSPNLNVRTIGICFEAQILDSFEMRAHDKPVDMVITEAP
jgi:5-formyltetrahydrofolate cyclo-ligase